MGWPHRMHGTGSLACHLARRRRQAELAYLGSDLRLPPGFTPGLTWADMPSMLLQLAACGHSLIVYIGHIDIVSAKFSRLVAISRGQWRGKQR